MRDVTKGSLAFGFLLFLVGWEWIARAGGIGEILASPTAIVSEGRAMIASGELWSHFVVTAGRVLAGYGFAAVVGVGLGLLMGRIRWIGAAIRPLLQFVRSISPVAIVPLAIIWFGIGEAAKHFVIFYSTVAIVILNSAAGAEQVPIARLWVARSFGLSPFKTFIRVILPSAFPFIVLGLRAGIGFAFMGVVAAEFIAAHEGLGFLVIQSQEFLATERMFVGLVTLGLAGFALDACAETIKNRMLRRFSHEM